jgi:hypothetical protein
MNSINLQLPTGFEALEPFVDKWAIEGSANRMQMRLDSSMDDMKSFFEAATPLAEPALALLDQKPLSKLDNHEKNLMNLILSLAHVSLAVEIQGPDEAFHAELAQFITITQSVADR